MSRSIPLIHGITAYIVIATIILLHSERRAIIFARPLMPALRCNRENDIIIPDPLWLQEPHFPNSLYNYPPNLNYLDGLSAAAPPLEQRQNPAANCRQNSHD